MNKVDPDEVQSALEYLSPRTIWDLNAPFHLMLHWVAKSAACIFIVVVPFYLAAHLLLAVLIQIASVD